MTSAELALKRCGRPGSQQGAPVTASTSVESTPFSPARSGWLPRICLDRPILYVSVVTDDLVDAGQLRDRAQPFSCCEKFVANILTTIPFQMGQFVSVMAYRFRAFDDPHDLQGAAARAEISRAD
jgi:hypothetical protein